MLLNSGLPTKEVAPKSWQGPSPNLKLLIKEDFPRTGDFVFRVEASRGYQSSSVERLIDLRKNEPASKSSKSIVIEAKKIRNKKGFILKSNRWLMPENVANSVNADFRYNVRKAGIYQVDLVHPYMSEDAMPSYQLSLFEGNIPATIVSPYTLTLD